MCDGPSGLSMLTGRNWRQRPQLPGHGGHLGDGVQRLMHHFHLARAPGTGNGGLSRAEPDAPSGSQMTQSGHADTKTAPMPGQR